MTTILPAIGLSGTSSRPADGLEESAVPNPKQAPPDKPVHNPIAIDKAAATILLRAEKCFALAKKAYEAARKQNERAANLEMLGHELEGDAVKLNGEVKLVSPK